MTEVEFSPEHALVEELVGHRDLIIFNDDFNTFDHVIECLMHICEHDIIQAEQCTLIIHHNGKCQVKRGEYEKLEPLCTALLERGLSAEIQ
jgi:ATP-dependent Clp protease adaptor protein ClpS